jgi:hypothetical protein
MGNELAAALRQFADRIERGEAMPDATQCALVLGDDSGNAQATYIGRYAPAQRAGIALLSAGVIKFNTEHKPHYEELGKSVAAGGIFGGAR